MSQETTTDFISDNPNLKPKLPTGLNVLTILTFVGCAFALYSTVRDFLTGKEAMEKLAASQSQMEKAPKWAQKFAGPEVQAMMQQALDNKIPVLIMGLVAVGLCVYGALEMRKLKKQGYILWLIGELLPFVSAAIFTSAFFNTIFIYFSIIPIIFILLYTMQRKHLNY